MKNIERFIPQLAGKDYGKAVVVNSRGTESKKDVLELEYLFDDQKLTIKEIFLKLCNDILKLQQENKLLKEELLLKIEENKNLQNEINKSLLEYIKNNGGII